MIYFKSCKRCSGDRSLERDYYGWYVICLICGYVTYPDIAEPSKQVIDGKRKPAAWPGAVAEPHPLPVLPASGIGDVADLRFPKW